MGGGCGKLRGGVDASQNKDHGLTILFIKYVSDKSCEGLEEL